MIMIGLLSDNIAFLPPMLHAGDAMVLMDPLQVQLQTAIAQPLFSHLSPY